MPDVSSDVAGFIVTNVFFERMNRTIAVAKKSKYIKMKRMPATLAVDV